MGSVVPTDWERAMRLTDSAEARLEAISFFVAALLVSAVAVRWLWNRLATDFSWLPRLSYGKSLAVVAVWGLLFLVVLTMIAATREAMTPGSWHKVGMLYQVAESAPPPPANTQRTAERMRCFERLKAALWSYAAGHDGRFPDAAEPNIAASLWERRAARACTISTSRGFPYATPRPSWPMNPQSTATSDWCSAQAANWP